MFLSPLSVSLSPHSLLLHLALLLLLPHLPRALDHYLSRPLVLLCPLTSYIPLPFPFPVLPSTWSLTHYLPPTLLCTLGLFQGSPPKFPAMSKVPVDNLKPTPFPSLLSVYSLSPLPLLFPTPFLFSFLSSLKGTHLKVFWSVD